jgi:FkbM family methyltransferase
MTFISYAQNFEDVMLWRALKHVENGFYIDVGANDPEHDSVTKAFYDRGWRGINIEPLPEYCRRLDEERPRDINLPIAAGESEGELILYDIPAVRGWASPKEAVAADHRQRGFDVQASTVPVRTLEKICEDHVKGDIHFLKIDVEGFELEVIRGMDFGKWRPWILVIEATLPNSQVSNHELWQYMLTEHGYHFAYFDGLNRYYVSEEHKDLARTLTTQPNIFDDFLPAAQLRALESAREAADRAQQAEARAQEADRQIAVMKRSMSWRLTRPLRWVREAREQQAEAKAREAEAKARETEEKAREAEVKAEKAEARAKEAETKAQRLQALVNASNSQLEAVYSSTSWKISAPLRAMGKLTKIDRDAARRATASARLLAKRMGLAAARRVVPMVRRSPVLTEWAWRVYRRFPVAGQHVLRRIKFSFSTDMAERAAREVIVIPDVPSAWEKSASLTGHFKTMLAQELQRRQVKHNGR